ncbi:DNA polymerase alpha/epsilon subunit B-domain-containing protein [Radiomyces spectabilis]|uniref:DNA polymerase alpha/epsilon subunit B-domain-containing protein n=1 Tax=Radiomyces spectabilis TaxID=64574 RepID=UPI00221F2080|nr:DNA polymerase alpha/epsilon subunit B-domain-containing protein [Radiomyces spectabilis]KAI8379698.1 DNA polymerase alpha/epsilon subunit B-domain-containing protein [Radiomyces spectabilis]
MSLGQRKKVARTAYLIFTKKHGLHVQTDATRFLEELLQDDPNIPETMEKIVKSYKKRYADQQAIIVDKASLQAVVTSLQTSAATAAVLTPFNREDQIQESLQDMTISERSEPVNVHDHFHVVEAFDMPKLQYDYHSKAFIKASQKPSILGSAIDKGDMYRDRFNLVKQRLLRNENFCPSSMHLMEQDAYLKITPIKALIGHDEERFLLFGMLTQLEEGKFFLEDEDANIELNLSQCAYGPGLFTDNAFVLAEGVFGEDHVFHVNDIGFPPAERRDMSDTLFSHMDFMGLPRPLVELDLLKDEEEAHNEISFVILSELWLDQPKVMSALYQMFEGYANEKIPLAFILIGNFTSQAVTANGIESRQYKDNFSAFADMVAEFPALATHSYFVFVPGSRDPWGGNILPHPPIPNLFTSRVKQKIRKAIFTSNPCRIRYCTQDIVIYREDILNRMWRNVLLRPNIEEESDPAKHLIRTLLDQGHMCPLPLNIRPIYWAHDHALRLYPLPHTLVLADQCDNYGMTYEGTHCINPGSFPNSDFVWSVYYPSTRTSERRQLS